ncbi:hypothetical protein ADL01_06160 [Streptomyces sp. NRRL WC-3618]|nr:hypothetical protein ADL01_06160 [Streptomyces sp. NRRL WC-3618]
MVGCGVETFVFAGDVVAPVGVEVSVGEDGTQSQYGFPSVKAPAGAGDVEAVGDQGAAGALNRADGDRPAVVQRRAASAMMNASRASVLVSPG